MSIVERAIAKAAAVGRRSPEEATQVARRVPAAGVSSDRAVSSPKATVDIEWNALRATGLAPPRDMANRIAEELRLIKRPLLLNAESDDAPLPNGNLIMVGSALPGAGKTFLSLNLALSMASEPDWTVLLVDGDVSRASLSKGLGLSDAPGLVGLLEQERADSADFVFKTDLPRLHFLPAGPVRPHAKELLGSQKMRAFVETLRQGDERRIVIFDSPPLLLTSEARVLASYAGQIVLVVEAGITPRRSILEAIEILDSTKAINLVLNKSRQLLGIGDYQYASYGPSAEQLTPKD